MSCSCRVAPMRSFIRGLVQVHKLDPSLSPVRFAPDSGLVASRRVIAARSTRAFHGSRELRQDAAAEAPTPPTESRQPMPVDSSSSQSLEGHSEAAKEDSGSNPAKKPKAKSKTPKAKPAKPKASKTAKLAKKPKEDAEGSEDIAENSPKKRKPRTKPEDAASTSPRKSKAPKGFKSDKPKDNKIRDIADSIVARRATDKSPEDEPPEKKKPTWLVQKEALAKKFPDGWSPHKRLSPDALAGIRALNAQFPDVYNVPALSQHFKVSPENIRRILKSRWKPSQDEEEDRERRWHMRGKSIWEARAAIGIKPPKKWREMGVTREAAFHARRQRGIEERKQAEEQEKAEYKSWREQYNKQHGIV